MTVQERITGERIGRELLSDRRAMGEEWATQKAAAAVGSGSSLSLRFRRKTMLLISVREPSFLFGRTHRVVVRTSGRIVVTSLVCGSGVEFLVTGLELVSWTSGAGSRI